MAITVPMSRVAKQMTVTINLAGMRPFRLRCFVGLWIIRLGASILPMVTRVEVDH